MLFYWVSPYAYLNFNDLRILVNHGDKNNPKELAELAANYRANIVIYGHSHIYNLEIVENVILLNLGSPSLPKGDNIPTAAVIEENLIKIININNGETLKTIELNVV